MTELSGSDRQTGTVHKKAVSKGKSTKKRGRGVSPEPGKGQNQPKRSLRQKYQITRQKQITREQTGSNTRNQTRENNARKLLTSDADNGRERHIYPGGEEITRHR